jgi:hypothetical protein
VRFHAGNQPDVIDEGAPSNAHAIARAKWRGQLDQPANLTSLQLGDHGVGDDRRRHTVHDEPDDTGRPSCGVPLHLNEDEGVTREQQRRGHHLAPAHDAALAQSWCVRLKASLLKEMESYTVTM